MHHLDDIDIAILKHLQKNGRAQRNKIAKIVNLSVPSVSERMRKLEEKKLIDGYHAVLNAQKFGFDIIAYIFVEVDNSSYHSSFVNSVVQEPEVQECHSITGDGSHILKIATKNTVSLERLLSRIQSWEGVKKTRSNIVLSTFKETREIPISDHKVEHEL
ncbi:Lrp/AsnC family transcriptional regulator [Balneolaceae bacterium ANBcel3]|nr:Lrp/AsnC family transcriptional regulator [Balneolaceae bacterium ANBcel3]